MCCYMYFSALGEGWVPVLMDNDHEHNFLRAAQRGINDTRSYWIGGTARWHAGSPYDPTPGSPEDFLDDSISMFHLINTYLSLLEFNLESSVGLSTDTNLRRQNDFYSGTPLHKI